MTFLRAVLKRTTCIAFAFRRDCHEVSGFSRVFLAGHYSYHSSREMESNLRTSSSTRRHLVSSSSSSFTPPVPPSSKGVPVFTDIDFSISKSPNSESFQRNNDPDAVFVVTGASRGIGKEFVNALMQRTKGKIVACCRSPNTASDLASMVSTSDRVDIIQLDVADQKSIEDAGASIQEKYGRVDMLLNVAGILGDGVSTPGPERSLSKMDRDWVEETMAVNCIGPVMLSKELAPLMKSKSLRRRRKDEQQHNAPPPPRPTSVIANLSARVGSISDNELGGWYSYRFSKAALNQATRTMSHELKRQGTWSVALHPGTTNTDLSKPFQRNVQEGRLFPVDFTVGQLLDVIDSLQDENSGGLYDWAGTALPF